MFGVPLETAIERSRLGSDGIELPTVFRQCIDFIEDNGERSLDCEDPRPHLTHTSSLDTHVPT